MRGSAIGPLIFSALHSRLRVSHACIALHSLLASRTRLSRSAPTPKDFSFPPSLLPPAVLPPPPPILRGSRPLVPCLLPTNLPTQITFIIYRLISVRNSPPGLSTKLKCFLQERKFPGNKRTRDYLMKHRVSSSKKCFPTGQDSVNSTHNLKMKGK